MIGYIVFAIGASFATAAVAWWGYDQISMRRKAGGRRY